VDYWSACAVTQTNYTVRINNGGDTQIVTGSFTGTGDAGGSGSGRTVGTFERQSGPAVQRYDGPSSVDSAVLKGSKAARAPVKQ
jgi:hypothetical protein